MGAVALFKEARAAKFRAFQKEGLRGSNGTTGAKGDTGPAGPQGPIGERGPVGPKGETGHGERGERGPLGPPGTDGSQGGRGPQGELGPMPAHERRGDAVRFETAPGAWGSWIQLGGMQGHIPHGGGGLTDTRVRELIEELTVDEEFNTLIDTVGDFKYIGKALPGVATSTAQWKIKRIDLTVAQDADIVWAGGTADRNKVWDDRLTYTYTPTGV